MTTCPLKTRIIGALLLLYAGACVYFVATHDELQWDFHSYHATARAYAKGAQPYDMAAVTQTAADPGFVYPYSPLTLKFFAVFNRLDPVSAAKLFLALKCAMLALLLLIWRNLFFDAQIDLVFWLLCLLGFNATIFLDLRAGNVSIFEQLGIWLAFYFYTRRNLPLFSALIAVIATLKFQPILFLGLLFYSKDRKRYACLAGAAVVFGSIVWLNYAANPAHFHSFIHTIRGFSAECGGIINPSLGCFIADVGTSSGGLLNCRLFGLITLQWLVYAAVAAAIVLASLPSLARAARAQEPERERLLVFLACLVYALVCPRFKDYSYILLIPPAYHIIRRIDRKNAGLGGFLSAHGLANMKTSVVLLVVLCLTTGSSLPAIDGAWDFFWNYFPLWSVCFIWWLYELDYA
jgi:hypothetical protein